MEYEIQDLLYKTYRCKVKQVGAYLGTVTVKRKKKIGLKRKILGIFPVYEYLVWEDKLSNWEYRSIKGTHTLTRQVRRVDIAICFDEVSKTVYWRYDI